MATSPNNVKAEELDNMSEKEVDALLAELELQAANPAAYLASIAPSTEASSIVSQAPSLQPSSRMAPEPSRRVFEPYTSKTSSMLSSWFSKPGPAAAATAEVAPSKAGLSDIEKKIAELEASAERNRREAEEMARSKINNNQLAASVAASHAHVNSMMSKLRHQPDASKLASDIAALRRKVEFKQKGVEIAIVMDCTGSMTSHIDACKSKVLDISQLVLDRFPEAHVRVAFVGYRDFGLEAAGWDPHFKVHNFVDSVDLHQLQYWMEKNIEPGGGLNAEDVAGGLKRATELGWECSTRLLVHFADAPCHGDKYHGGYANNGRDTYPDGNPDGLQPEKLLKTLCEMRVDYHFARILHGTDMMTDIFAKVYAAAGRNFMVHDYDGNAVEFVPTMVKSITASMRRTGWSHKGGAEPRPLDDVYAALM